MLPVAGFLGVLCIIALARYIIGHADPTLNFGPSPETLPADASLAATEFSWRTAWTISFGVLLMSFVTVLAGTIVVMWLSLRRLSALIIALAIAVIGSTAIFSVLHSVRILPDLCAPFLARVHLAHASPELFSRIMANAAMALSVFLVIASAVLLKPIGSADPIVYLRLRMRRLRGILYMGGFLMISNTISVAVLYRWAAAVGGPLSEQACVVSRSLSFATGAMHTMLFVGFYLPASLVLARRANMLAAQHAKDSENLDTHKWLLDRGLVSNPIFVISRSVIALGPVLVGSIIPIVIDLFR